MQPLVRPYWLTPEEWAEAQRKARLYTEIIVAGRAAAVRQSWRVVEGKGAKGNPCPQLVRVK
jgi:hypothetical protein